MDLKPTTDEIMGNLARSSTNRSTDKPRINAAACDLALSQWSLSAAARTQILRQTVEHAPTLSEFVAQSEFHNIRVAVPEGWNAYNPSIANTSQGLLMTVRSSNWVFKRHHYFRINDPDEVAGNRNYLVQLDANLSLTSSVLLRDGADRAGEGEAGYRGYEDLRLFERGGHLGAVAATLDFSLPGVSRMALLGISGDQLNNRRLISDGSSRSEKNWTPAIWNGELFLVYRYAPMTLLRWDGNRLHPAGLDAYLGPPIALDFKGGSPLVSTRAGFLAVVHAGADYADESRVYMHRFVLLDDEFRIIGHSHPFTFRQRGIEFAAGLALQEEDVIVSFGADDAECWLVRLPLDSILGLLTTPIEPVPEAHDEAASRVWPPIPEQGRPSTHRPVQNRANSVARDALARPMNRPTIITSMLIPQSDGHTTRPVAEYLAHFEHLVATGMPIVVYVAPSLAEQVRAPNVTVVPTSLEDLPLWREMQGMELRLPATRNPVKDTADYLALQNSKTELVRRTIATTDADAMHAFVDFGIFHFIRDTQRAQDRIRALGATCAELVTLPGCVHDVSDYVDRVNWRFCGSFFYGPAAAMLAFADLHQKRAEALLPTLSWEINVWAWMERHGELACRWYKADHNDSIFDYPEICLP